MSQHVELLCFEKAVFVYAWYYERETTTIANVFCSTKIILFVSNINNPTIGQ